MLWRMTLATGLVIAVLGATATAGLYYEQQVDVYTCTEGSDVVEWGHTYDSSADPIASAMLTIVADDVDNDECDEVYFNGRFLGYLEDMGVKTSSRYDPGPGHAGQPLTTTVFRLDPSWIEPHVPATVLIDASWGVEIETSTLGVSAIPAPGALVSVLTGLVCLGGYGVRRRLR